MDRNSDAQQSYFLKLIKELGLMTPASEPESNDTSDPSHRVEEMQGDASVFDQPGSQSADSGVSERAESILQFQEGTLLQPGEIPAVQDRFQALLKRRLQLEIQRKPPLFPWEREISDYQSEPLETVPLMAASPLWLAQLRQLSLPIPMPEELLAELLGRCQSLVAASLRDGAKLVKAVESLFPEDISTLNQLAGVVLASPARSGRSAGQSLPAIGAAMPSDYEAAAPVQQMVLSLLAAREILNTLTLTVSPQQPRNDREWLTELGALGLQIDFQPSGSLRIEGSLPGGGSLQLKGDSGRAFAERTDAGNLTVELHGVVAAQTCELEVRLADQDTLNFVIQVQP